MLIAFPTVLFGNGQTASPGGGFSTARQPVGNGNLAPYTYNDDTGRVLNIRKRRWVAKDADRNSIRLRFGNFWADGTSESTSLPTLVIKTGISTSYNETPTAALFGGQAEYVLTSNSIVESDSVVGLTLTANTPFYECTRVVYPLLFDAQSANFTVGQVVTGGTSGATGTIHSQTDGGASGSLVLINESGTFVDNETITDPLGGSATVDLATTQQQIYTVTGHAFFNEGVKGGNNTSIDYSDTAPNTFPTLSPTVTAGEITSVSGSGGTGNTDVPNLTAYEYVNNILYFKNIGYCDVSAGAVSGAVVTDGTPPSGLANWVSPTIVPTGGSGFGNTTGVFCALEVNGIPLSPVKSLTIIGDSIARGDSSTDTTGDLYNNHGLERVVKNECAVNNMSRAGASASYDIQYATLYPTLYDAYMDKTSHALITLGSNDIVVGGTKADLESDINTIKTYVKTFGTLVSVATIIPRVTGTFATEVGQTPDTGFAASGVMDNYNIDVIANTVVSDFGYYNPYAFYRGTDPNKWRVDLGVMTAEGIHPSLLGFGTAAADATLIGYFSTNLT